MNESQMELVLDWMRKIHRMEWAHRFEAKRWKIANLVLGIASIILATMIAGIPTVPGISPEIQQITIAVGAIVVAIISGFQTFLKPSKMAERLGNRSDEYEAMRHELEQIYEFSDDLGPELQARLDKIRDTWKEVPSMSVSDTSFNKAGGRVSSYGRYPSNLSFSRKT